MTSTTLSADRPALKKRGNFASMLFWTLKKNIAITVVYTTLLFVSFPLLLLWATAMILTTAAQTQTATFPDQVSNYVDDMHTFVIYGYPVTSLLTALFAVITAAIIFNYLHNKRSVDMYNALPLSRSEMYFSRYLAGLLIVTVPVIINHLLGVIIMTAVGDTAPLDFAPQLIYVLLSAVGVYSFTTFLSVCAGKTSNAVILSIGLSAALPLTVFISNLMVSGWAPGFSMLLDIPSIVYMLFSPESVAFAACYAYNIYENGMTADTVILTVYFVLFTAVMIFGGYAVYSKRKMENAQSEAFFKLPEYIIRVIITYGSGITLGVIFSMVFSMESRSAGLVWFWIGALFATAAAHIVLEAILNKGLTYFVKNLKLYAVALVSLILIFACASTGVFGLYAYVPAANGVNYIKLDAEPEFLSSYYWMYDDQSYDDEVIVSDIDTINLITDIHRKVIDNINRHGGIPFCGSADDLADGLDYSYDYSPVTVSYIMRNGNVVKRHYESEYTSDESVYSGMSELLYNKEFMDTSISRVQKFIKDSKYYYGNENGYIDITLSSNKSYSYYDKDEGIYEEHDMPVGDDDYAGVRKEKAIELLEVFKSELNDSDKLDAMKKAQKILNDGDYSNTTIYTLDINPEGGNFSITFPAEFTETLKYFKSIAKN